MVSFLERQSKATILSVKGCKREPDVFAENSMMAVDRRRTKQMNRAKKIIKPRP